MNKIHNILIDIAALVEQLIIAVNDEYSERNEASLTRVELITVNECIELCSGLSKATLRHLIKGGVVPYIRTGEGKNGKILVNKQKLIEYLNGISENIEGGDT